MTKAVRFDADATFRGFFESLAVGGIQISSDGQFLEVNARLCTLTGYDREELLSMRVGDLDHPDDRPADAERWAAFLSDSHARYDTEKRYVRRDGSVIWVHVTAARIASGSDRVLIAKTVEDITEQVATTHILRESEQRLRAALAVKEDFLGLVSHELRTPLTVILGMADVMTRPTLPPDRLRELALEIRQSAEHLATLLESMLVLARMDREEASALEPLQLAHVLRRAVARHREVHRGRDIRLELRTTHALVEAHEPWIAQVIGNLLGNAEKYSPPRSPITVVLEQDGDMIVVRVLDEGVGIDQADEDHVFEPFYRAPRAQATSGGLGLGLAVCKRLVEMQGGDIWARTRAAGGTEFSFSLPSLEDRRDPDAEDSIASVVTGRPEASAHPA